MQTPMKKYSFENDSFQISTDYEALWELVQLGGRVPAWLVHTDKYDPPIWDLVEIKLPYLESSGYRIGTRGIGYEGKQDKDSFLDICAFYSIHFITPHE